jgi:hypothetical protein
MSANLNRKSRGGEHQTRARSAATHTPHNSAAAQRRTHDTAHTTRHDTRHRTHDTATNTLNMFQIARLEDASVKILPENLGKPRLEAITQEIESLYIDKVVKNLGGGCYKLNPV